MYLKVNCTLNVPVPEMYLKVNRFRQKLYRGKLFRGIYFKENGVKSRKSYFEEIPRYNLGLFFRRKLLIFFNISIETKIVKVSMEMTKYR